MKKYLFIAAILSAFAISCTTSNNEPIAGGGDEFPNSMDPSSLGKRIAGDIENYDNWDDTYLASPEISVPVTPGNISIPSQQNTGLGKQAGSNADSLFVNIDSTDTATLGIARICITTIGANFNKYDTIALKWDDRIHDNIADNEHIVSIVSKTEIPGLQSVTIIRYEDSDGDGIINNSSGDSRRASAYVEIQSSGGYRDITFFNIDAGSDKSFDTDSGNIVLDFRYMKLYANDTIEYFSVFDADDDSVIFITGSADSCIVDIAHRIKNKQYLSPTDKKSYARYVIFPSDSTLNYFIRLSSSELTLRKSWYFDIFGPRHDSTFLAGDTVWGRMVSRNNLIQCTTFDSVFVTMKMGPVPQDSSDDSLCAIYSYSKKCGENESEVRFSFESVNPIGAGQKPQAGALAFEIKFNDGEWISAKGSFDNDGIEAEYTDSKGNKILFKWDRQGSLLSRTVIK